MFAVTAGHQPRRQIVLQARGERQHLNELRLLLARQPHDRVVGLHRRRVGLTINHRHLPLVFLVVEDLRIGHVERRERGRLHLEDAFGISHVAAKFFRHLGQRLEHSRKDPAHRLHDRVVRLGDVERHRPVIRVDDHFHRVADVVAPTHVERCRVRIVRTGRVGVLDPENAPLRHNRIGIRVVLEERRERTHPTGNPAVVHDAAFGGDLIGDENVRGAKTDRKHHAPRQAAQLHAPRPRVRRRHVVFAAGIVKLGLQRLDQGVVARQLTEVDAGFRDINVDVGHRRQVPDKQHRLTRRGHLVDRPKRQAVTVCKRQPLVDP